MAKKQPPPWCDTPELKRLWREPWTVSLDGRKDRVFKRRLWEHGFLSPHFTRDECKSKDGVSIPKKLKPLAQRQAFRMERYRHAKGDKPVSFISWYRSPVHNANVGGAPLSRHKFGDGTDGQFDPDVALRIWTTGGIGWAGPGVGNGAILHLDSRPHQGLVQWSYS